MKAKDLNNDEMKKVLSSSTYKVLRENMYSILNDKNFSIMSISTPFSPIGFKHCEGGVEIFNIETEEMIDLVPDCLSKKEVAFAIIDAYGAENFLK